jgi:amidophosphoribosyltransferase
MYKENRFRRTILVTSHKPQERCGVVALATKSKTSTYIYYCLRALQHRGQEAAGIATFSKKIETQKGLGLIANAFDDKELKNLKGKKGIGHTYYSIKLSKPENAQPTIIKTDKGEIALAHNGILVNAENLKRKLKKKGHKFVLGCEEEVVAFLIYDYLEITGDLIKAIKKALVELSGSYSFTMMYKNRVFGIRDPLGIKPLCIGKLSDGYVVASESVALDVIGGELIRDVYPGELIELTPTKYISHQLFNEKHKAHCFFEYTYFARADSTIDGRSVYETRKRIGWRLAKEHPVKAHIALGRGSYEEQVCGSNIYNAKSETKRDYGKGKGQSH